MKEIKKKIDGILKEKLFEYGFLKKNSAVYYRVLGDTEQELVFGFSSNGEKKVRYLSYTVMFFCPDIEDMAAKLEESIGCIGLNVGFLMPNPCYKEWKFTAESSDNDIKDILDEVTLTVSHYAIPYLERFSEKEKIAYGLETGVLDAIYEVKERCDAAIRRRTLDFPVDDYKALQAIYGEEAIQIPPNKDLECYLPFAEKFREMVTGGEP